MNVTIDQVCAALKAAAKKYPEHRAGQLITNALYMYRLSTNHGGADLYYAKNEVVRDALLAYAKN